MWYVTAKGWSTGKEYVYRVSMPWDAREVDVIGEAYGAHGQLKRQGMVAEFLSPHYEVEWVNNV